MAGYRKLKSGKHQITIYIGKEDGKTRRKSFSARTKREAQAMAREYLAKHPVGSIPTITVEDAINEYISLKENVLSPATVRSYKAMSRNKFKDIKPIKIDALTQQIVQASINKEAAKSSPKSVRNQYHLLTASLKMYDISFNLHFPQKVKKEITIPDEELIQMLMDKVKGTELYIPVLLGSLCGMRRSEICALEWDDINFENNTIHINKAIVPDEYGIYTIKTTKTMSSTRYIPMSDGLSKVLKEYKGTGRVVKIQPHIISDRFRRLIRKTTDKPFRFHDLRHYCASVMLALNIPDKYAMEIMGHQTPNMLKNVYQHIMDEKKKEVFNSITEHADKVLNER